MALLRRKHLHFLVSHFPEWRGDAAESLGIALNQPPKSSAKAGDRPGDGGGAKGKKRGKGKGGRPEEMEEEDLDALLAAWSGKGPARPPGPVPCDELILGDTNFGPSEDPRLEPLGYVDVWTYVKDDDEGYTFNVEKNELAKITAADGVATARALRPAEPCSPPPPPPPPRRPLRRPNAVIAPQGHPRRPRTGQHRRPAFRIPSS